MLYLLQAVSFLLGALVSTLNASLVINVASILNVSLSIQSLTISMPNGSNAYALGFLGRTYPFPLRIPQWRTCNALSMKMVLTRRVASFAILTFTSSSHHDARAARHLSRARSLSRVAQSGMLVISSVLSAVTHSIRRLHSLKRRDMLGA